MAECSRCRCDVGLLRLVTGSRLCEPCQRIVAGSLQQFESAVSHALADRLLSPEEESELRRLQYELGLSDEQIAAQVPALARARSLYHVAMGSLPTVDGPPGLLMRKGEVCHHGTGANLFSEVVVQQYVGGSSGYSVRIMKGVSVRGGSSRGVRVPVAHLAFQGSGALAITNKRTVFLGPELIAIPHGMLLAVTPFADGVEFHYHRQRNRRLFQVHDGELVAAIVTMVAQQV